MKILDNAKPKQQWRETHLKGRMAETLVFDLLKEAGNQVYQIGYETILPGLADPDSFVRNSSVGKKITKIPDLFVLDKNGNPYLIEVKFRWNPRGHENDQDKLELIRKHWEEAIVVFVNCDEKPYFRFGRYPFSDFSTALQEFVHFNISLGLVDKFQDLVDKYLGPTRYEYKSSSTGR